MSAYHAENVRRMLENGEAAMVLGLRKGPEGISPHIFTTAPEAADLEDGPKYPLAKIAWRTLRHMPEGTSLAVVCRTCDSRAIREQERMGQYTGKTVITLVVPCDAEQAERCSCAMPTPSAMEGMVEEATPADPLAALSPDLRLLVGAAEGGNGPDRAAAWREILQRCIKCYGCRTICPVCICPECRLEDPDFVQPTVLPPSPLPWHLCRATHVAEHCVGCGACADACPAGIPLQALHSAIAGYLYGVSGYVAGLGMDPPLSRPAKAAGPTGTAPPQWIGPCSPGVTDGTKSGTREGS